MANSGKKHMRSGTQGKGTGTGANTEVATGDIGENDVLSNRDKAQHSKQPLSKPSPVVYDDA